MDSIDCIENSTDHSIIYRLSWVKYLRLFLFFIFFSFISIVIISSSKETGWVIGGLIFETLVLIRTIISFLGLRAWKLYSNQDGVWIYSGIFPWSKGTYGVKWRDIDSAITYTGFFSWLTNSHAVVIKHRFSKEDEIAMSNVYHGKEAVFNINNSIMEFNRNNNNQ